MTTLPLENIDVRRLSEALHQKEEHSVLVTENSRPLGLLLSLEKPAQGPGADAVLRVKTDDGEVLVIVRVKWIEPKPGEMGSPGFGSCRNMITIVSDEDEHLDDFSEYMQ